MHVKSFNSREQRTTTGLVVESVTFSYHNTSILSDIDLTIQEGEFVCLLGPSGCGKTTLLRLLAGLEQPKTGSVRWKGSPITGPALERGVVFQDYSLFPWISLVGNIKLALSKSQPNVTGKWRHQLAEEYLEMVGLGAASRKYPMELSGGMQQRGAIARTLALGSPVLLLDEPFGALDPVKRAKLQELVLEVWSSSTPRKTVVFVTHDVEESLYLADRVVMLGASPGRIIHELEVPFPRPRVRRNLTGSAGFIQLREEIEERFRLDVIERLEEEFTVSTRGEGI